VLVLKEVCYSYPGSESPALSGVSISLSPGTVVVFEGDNGSGKTTLGLVLCGAIPAFVGGVFHGDVRFRGRALSAEIIPSVSAFVFQDPYTYFSGHTLGEEMALLEGDGIRLREILSSAIVDRELETPLYQFSYGQQQLLAVASALLTQREIAVLDEPFSALDMNARCVVTQLMKEARERGALVVVLQSLESEKDTVVSEDLYLVSHGELRTTSVPRERIGIRPLEKQTVLSDCVLEARELSYAYPGSAEHVFNGVNLGVRKGESLGIAGENGVGKSTLLLLISGLIRARGGELILNGRKANRRDLRSNIKCAFQNPDVQVFGQSVRDELTFGLRLARVEKREIERRIESISSKLPFGIHRDPFSLSYGQRKLLTLASTYAFRPSVIAMDEPLAGLDESSRNVVRELVESFLGDGGSLLVTAHDRSALRFLCHRTVTLEARGRSGSIINDSCSDS